MFCPQCGSQIKIGSSLCTNCGAKVGDIASKAAPTQQRALGLVLITIYTAFGGVLSLLMGTVSLFAAGLPVPGWVPFLSILLILLGVLSLAACYGLWTIQKWGLTLAIVLYIAYIPLDILSLFIEAIIGEITAGSILLTVVSIAVAIIILRYLFKPEIKALFGKQS